MEQWKTYLNKCAVYRTNKTEVENSNDKVKK
jgi:hypothetical protein